MKMKKFKKLILLSLFCLCSFGALQAQEVLSGLYFNPVLMNKEKPVRSKNAEAVKLPFLDDFSNYTGYPKASLWQDDQAFVNASYPVRPPTLGVVTLDAIDANGRIYEHAENQPFGADTLTSRPIRLDTNFMFHRPFYASDSIYFSFYYQPAGMSESYPAVEWERIGNQPEVDDSLVLEFGYPTGNLEFIGYEYSPYEVPRSYHAGDSMVNPFFLPDTVYYVFETYVVEGESIVIPSDSLFGPEYKWNHIWSTSGCSVDNWLADDPLNYFKRVMIPITDNQYFRSDFQFRFRNYASLEPNGYDAWSSNVDQWNIDYVRLDFMQTCIDKYPDDVAFVSPTTSALKEYQSMPWNQYRTGDMKENFHNELANISDETKNTSYGYWVFNEQGGLVGNYPENNFNANPYYPSGLHDYTYHVNPEISFTFPANAQDSAIFYIKHVFQVVGSVGDDCASNDTCIFEQKFYNYYAYDDGTAEAGYSLISEMTNPSSDLAVRFTLAEPDTLRGVRLWFNSTLNDANIEPFTLMVWADNGGKPGEVLLSVPQCLPVHAENFLDFVYYPLEEPLPVSGTFYVGTNQTHNVPLNIGFDQNNDARAHWVYRTADTWCEPFFLGAPMIRPVLGKYFDPTRIANSQSFDFAVYPNPARQQVTVRLNENLAQAAEATLWDMTGRCVAAFRLTGSGQTLDLSNLVAGMYLLKVAASNHSVVKKIIKQ